jgi:hypothetical protein
MKLEFKNLGPWVPCETATDLGRVLLADRERSARAFRVIARKDPALSLRIDLLQDS